MAGKRTSVVPDAAPSLTPSLALVVTPGLLDASAKVDPRDPRGVRFALATLPALGVYAVISAGYNSLAATAEWVRRCDQLVLALTDEKDNRVWIRSSEITAARHGRSPSPPPTARGRRGTHDD